MIKRHRKARSDSKVRGLKTTVANLFGIPRECIRITSPSGRAFNAAAKISTIRKKWEKHLSR